MLKGISDVHVCSECARSAEADIACLLHSCEHRVVRAVRGPTPSFCGRRLGRNPLPSRPREGVSAFMRWRSTSR